MNAPSWFSIYISWRNPHPSKFSIQVSGVVGVVTFICQLGTTAAQASDEDTPVAKVFGGIRGLASLTYFCLWFPATYWVFSNWSWVNFEDPTHEHYCNETAYMFAFILLIVGWVVYSATALACCLPCCLLSAVACWTAVSACLGLAVRRNKVRT